MLKRGRHWRVGSRRARIHRKAESHDQGKRKAGRSWWRSPDGASWTCAEAWTPQTSLGSPPDSAGAVGTANWAAESPAEGRGCTPGSGWPAGGDAVPRPSLSSRKPELCSRIFQYTGAPVYGVCLSPQGAAPRGRNSLEQEAVEEEAEPRCRRGSRVSVARSQLEQYDPWPGGAPGRRVPSSLRLPEAHAPDSLSSRVPPQLPRPGRAIWAPH